MQDDWFNGLSLAAQGKILARWNAVAGTADLWANNVAQISHLGYKSYPNPAFASKRGRSSTQIVAVQLRKLTNAFTKAKENHDAVFANAGSQYITDINNKAGAWAAAMLTTLAVTGSRLQGKRGAVSIHVRALCSDFTYVRDLQGTTSVTGIADPLDQVTPEHRYIRSGWEGMFRAALEGKLQQQGIALLHGDETDPTADNTLVTDVLNQYLQPGYTGTIGWTTGPLTLTTTVTGTAAP
jgi:hypothetical protein